MQNVFRFGFWVALAYPFGDLQQMGPGFFPRALGLILVGTFVWLLMDLHVLHADGRTGLVWIGLVAFGAVLGAGLSWSLIRARATGQVEVQ